MLNLLLFSLIVYKSPVETKALQSCKDGSDTTGGAVRISPVILAGESVCKQSSLSTKSVVTENQEHQKDYKRPVLEKQDICDTTVYTNTHQAFPAEPRYDPRSFLGKSGSVFVLHAQRKGLEGFSTVHTAHNPQILSAHTSREGSKQNPGPKNELSLSEKEVASQMQAAIRLGRAPEWP